MTTVRRGTLALVLATTAAAPAAAERCVSVPAALEAQKRANATTEANFAKELAKQKLATVALPRHTAKTRGPQATHPRLDVAAPIDGVTVVYTGTTQQCGSITETEFVQRGTHIFRLQRQPKLGSAHIAACECYFPGYRCGGAVPPKVDMLYELPPNTTYDGVLAVAYDALDPTIRGGVAPKTACVMPPPPP